MIQDGISSFDVSPDGLMIIAGTRDGVVRMWTPPSRAVAALLRRARCTNTHTLRLSADRLSYWLAAVCELDADVAEIILGHVEVAA